MEFVQCLYQLLYNSDDFDSILRRFRTAEEDRKSDRGRTNFAFSEVVVDEVGFVHLPAPAKPDVDVESKVFFVLKKS